MLDNNYEHCRGCIKKSVCPGAPYCPTNIKETKMNTKTFKIGIQLDSMAQTYNAQLDKALEGLCEEIRHRIKPTSPDMPPIIVELTAAITISTKK